ncbi:hypothetical protein SARC_15331, partial [Sphaeroforma arctica JP610]
MPHDTPRSDVAYTSVSSNTDSATDFSRNNSRSNDAEQNPNRLSTTRSSGLRSRTNPNTMRLRRRPSEESLNAYEEEFDGGRRDSFDTEVVDGVRAQFYK